MKDSKKMIVGAVLYTLLYIGIIYASLYYYGNSSISCRTDGRKMHEEICLFNGSVIYQ